MVTASTVLLQAPNREVVKAVLGFLKVAIVMLPPEQLGPHVPEIVRRPIGWQRPEAFPSV